jgi:hypothetical protein
LGADATFNKDVLPILQQHCQSCHRKGEIGPMPLTTYEQVRPWAKAIRQSVTLRKMPPWFADPRFGEFSNNPSLTSDEISTVEKWVNAGALAGSKLDAPPAVKWPEGHAIPNPTLVTRMPQAFVIPARATVDYQDMVLRPGFPVDTWVTAVEIRPSDRSVVHHAVLYVREPGSTWLKDVLPGVMYSPPRDRSSTADILAVYTPGAPVMICPEGMAKKIPAGSDLVLQMHYTSKSVAARDQTEIALVTTTEPPHARLLTLQMANYDLTIPPGDRERRVTVAGTVPQDALLVSMFPHMHLRGSGFEYQILGGQGGRVETLLKVNDYNFYWQLSYQLKKPRPLPAGTRLLFAGYFDNSSRNPRNPDPSAEVTWGEQSWEEMMVGFFDVAVPPNIDKQAFFIRQQDNVAEPRGR